LTILKKKLDNINLKLSRYFGVPKRRKSKNNLIDILIATILSQNTNDKLSSISYKNLKNAFKDWSEVQRAPISRIEKAIQKGGLGRQKSRWIKSFLNGLEKSTGKINLSYLNYYNNEEVIKELGQYKGIGIKTTACLLLFGLHRNVIPVDTHIHRIINRIGFLNTKTPIQTFYSLQDMVSGNMAYDLHINLIRLGRSICKARLPVCCECPIEKECKYQFKNLVRIENLKSRGITKEYFILNTI
jgi:endonuclease-3